MRIITGSSILGIKMWKLVIFYRTFQTGWVHLTRSCTTGHISDEKVSVLLEMLNWNDENESRLPQIQIKLRWALFVTYTIIQSIMRSEMCSLHLTHPSGAVDSRHCSARGAVWGSVPCSRVSPQSWTLPARAGIRTHNLGLPRVSSPTL